MAIRHLDQPATLVINRSDSKCGSCGRGADPREKFHKRILSWGDKGPGCGVVWTKVTSHYSGKEIKEASMEMRPDLEWVDSFSGMH